MSHSNSIPFISSPHLLNSASSMAGALPHINGNSMACFIFRPNPNRPLMPPCRTIVKATMMKNQSYLASVNSDIEAHLKHAIPMREPVVVFGPMHHLTFSTPQSTAPALCVATCELIGGHRKQAVAAASALHLMHAAFFAHEHIQLSDHFRPKPMEDHTYGPGIKLMTGDAMIPFGFELLAAADEPTQNRSNLILQVMGEIGRATSTQGMIYGKYINKDLDQTSGNKSSQVERLERECECYEGVLHACAAACGAILGGGGEEEVERVRRFGRYVGKIQGLLKRAGEYGINLKNLVDELRNSAILELEGFDEAKVEAIIAGFTRIE